MSALNSLQTKHRALKKYVKQLKSQIHPQSASIVGQATCLATELNSPRKETDHSFTGEGHEHLHKWSNSHGSNFRGVEGLLKLHAYGTGWKEFSVVQYG